MLPVCRDPQRSTVTIWTSGKIIEIYFYENQILQAKVSKPKPNSKLRKEMDSDNNEFDKRRQLGLPRDMQADIRNDICVRLGFPGKYRDSTGKEQPTSGILRTVYQEMLKQTIDIYPPKSEDVINTNHGMLLRVGQDNEMFLKGIKLHQKYSFQKYHYSYAFLQGSTQRDRGFIRSLGEEVQAVSNILFAAANKEHSVMVKVCELLLVSKTDRCADVKHAECREGIRRIDGERVWEHLKTLGVWFYCAGCDHEVGISPFVPGNTC